jgi:hypothetical protein
MKRQRIEGTNQTVRHQSRRTPAIRALRRAAKFGLPETLESRSYLAAHIVGDPTT